MVPGLKSQVDKQGPSTTYSIPKAELYHDKVLELFFLAIRLLIKILSQLLVEELFNNI